jgi:2-phospho-L-lactate/phosphoenolpyruvate guanylyltransferase
VPSDRTTAWGVVVPVKRLAQAKTRLGAYGSAARAELALAFAADVVAAAPAAAPVRQVLVVTDDDAAARDLSALGALVTPDRPGAGLNPALEHGAALLRAARPDCGVATVSADVPCLRPDDLAAALRAVPDGGRAFVPDADRQGTTLLAAGPGAPLAPAYGARSRLRHLASGAVELPGTAALRRDVDTPEDLAQAHVLGLGPRTAAVVARLPPLDLR